MEDKKRTVTLSDSEIREVILTIRKDTDGRQPLPEDSRKALASALAALRDSLPPRP